MTDSPGGRFVWHDLMTTDVAGARAFYAALLGWEFQSFDADGIEYPMMTPPGAEMPLGGIASLGALRQPPHWVGYVFVDDVDGAVARAQLAGGSLVVPAYDIPGVGRSATLADPQGALFAPFRSASGEWPAAQWPPLAGSFVWNELVTDDIEGAKAFYATVAGWESREWEGEFAYDIFTRPDGQGGRADCAGLMARPPEMEALPLWVSYVNVPDIRATLARTTELGGAVYVEPVAVATIGELAVIGDPQGAPLGLLQPEG